MPTYTLTLLDTVSIQDYIFGSNVLRENIGASELVRRATRLWPFEEVRKSGKTNVKSEDTLTGDPDDLVSDLRIEDHSLNAEVIYAGGGNCAILFDERATATSFTTRLSKRVLEEAPELNLVIAHVDVDWHDDALADKVKQALDHLLIKKLERRVSTPLLGQGTTMACRSTGLPAVGTNADEPNLKPADEAPRAISAGILAKLKVLSEANLRLEQLLPQFRTAGLEVPYDFDNFGREAGDISYIAVVHADGNRMGERIEELRGRYPSPLDNRSYIQAMRNFSLAVETASRQALDEVSTLLLRHWRPTEDDIAVQAKNKWDDWISISEIKLVQGPKKRFYVPFRPIVFGGDDLTFVTDGRLGLGLAAAYLKAFENAIETQCQELEEKGAKISEHLQGAQACAGVSIVKTHYPFARAYALSEDLCRNAKQVWEREYSALDWHFATSGLFGGVDDIRQRQYTTSAGHLEMRPVLLAKQTIEWRTWEDFSSVVKTLLVEDDWKDHRNKVIALREALRKGPKTVKQFRHAYGLKELPLLASHIKDLQSTGWDGTGRCGYFDAVEALDFFLPLKEEKGEDG